MSSEPLIPLRTPAANQAMSIAAAYQRAAVDGGFLVNVTLAHEFVEGEGGATAVLITATDRVSGALVWEQPYDGRGHRITGAVSIGLGRK